LTSTRFVPSARIFRAARLTLSTPASSRASSSLMTRRSTRASSASSGPRASAIQWFIVSSPTSRAPPNWSSTPFWSVGSMLPRKTYGAFRIASLTRGAKPANTPRSSAIVSRLFMSSW
jgi:hypothetical protein